MSLTQITTHVADAQARLLTQVKQSPRMLALVGAFANEVQNLENALFAAGPARYLANASGSALDSVATLVGAPARNGLTDAQYKPIVLGQVAINTSDGTIPALLNIVLTLFSATSAFIKTPDSHALANRTAAYVSIGIGSPALPTSLYGVAWGLLLQAVSAGICIDHAYIFNSNKAFSMAGAQSWVGGFDDGTGTVGGAFAASLFSNAAY